MTGKLSRRQERALLALLENDGLALNLVAKKANISESTLFRYLRDDTFLAEWRALRAQAVERAIADLQSLTAQAVEALRRNLDTGNRPSEVRTALGILSKSLDALDTFDLAERIARIEKDMAKRS